MMLVQDALDAQGRCDTLQQTPPAGKLLSCGVPCFNSAAYMHTCIDSLLAGGDRIEILIVNDGSNDETFAIATAYERKYPTICRALDQENGGYGAAVNTAIGHATGRYYKTVDSDDWLEAGALTTLLDAIEAAGDNATQQPDLIVTNYVYEHVASNSTHAVNYRKMMPVGRPFAWNELGHSSTDQYITVHGTTYRTQLLRDCALRLPEHLFYVDSFFVYHPMAYTQQLLYLDIDLYHYFIGRSDQSINVEVLKRRIDQQIRATQLLIDDHDMTPLRIQSPKKAAYMTRYLSIMMAISTVYLLLCGGSENVQKKDALWAYLAEKDPAGYLLCRKSLAGLANRHTWLGRKVVTGGYLLAKRLYKFA